MIDRDFTALENAAAGSLPGRAVHAVAEIVTASTRTSQTGKSARAAWLAWSALDEGERVKRLLLTIGSATIFYAMLLSIEPPYVASGIPKLWYYGAGTSLVLLSMASRALAAALSNSAVARFGRWLIR
jgi:hypothetical protein